MDKTINKLTISLEQCIMKITQMSLEMNRLKHENQTYSNIKNSNSSIDNISFAEIISLKKRVDDKNIEIENLNNSLNFYKKNLIELKNSNFLKEKNENLKIENDNLNLKIEELENFIEILKSNLTLKNNSETKEGVDYYKNELIEEIKNLKKYQYKYKCILNQLKDKEELNKKLNNSLNKKEFQIRYLKGHLVFNNIEIPTKDNICNPINDKNITISNDNVFYLDKIKKLEDETNIITNENINWKNNLKEKLKDIENKDNKISFIINENNTYKEIIKENKLKEKNIFEVKSNYNKVHLKNEDLEKSIIHKESENKELKSKLLKFNEIKKNNELLKEKLDQVVLIANKEYNEKNKSIKLKEEYENKLNNLEQEYSRICHINEVNKSKIDNISFNIKDFKSENDGYISDIKSKNEEILNLKEKIKNNIFSNQEYKNRKNEIKLLKEIINEKEIYIEKLEKENNSINLKNNEINENYINILNTNSENKLDIKLLNDNILILKNQLDDKNKLVKKLNMKIEMLNANISNKNTVNKIYKTNDLQSISQDNSSNEILNTYKLELENLKNEKIKYFDDLVNANSVIKKLELDIFNKNELIKKLHLQIELNIKNTDNLNILNSDLKTEIWENHLKITNDYNLQSKIITNQNKEVEDNNFLINSLKSEILKLKNINNELIDKIKILKHNCDDIPKLKSEINKLIENLDFYKNKDKIYQEIEIKNKEKCKLNAILDEKLILIKLKDNEIIKYKENIDNLQTQLIEATRPIDNNNYKNFKENLNCLSVRNEELKYQNNEMIIEMNILNNTINNQNIELKKLYNN